MRRALRSLLIVVGLMLLCCVAAFAVLQLIPYGRTHQNPPVLQEPQWDSQRTRELAVRACYDCHSNETVWPWYSNIAPVSWIVERDVDEGRAALNFSEWQAVEDPGDPTLSIQEGSMPPRIYLLQHPASQLSPLEEGQLIEGLKKTCGLYGR